MKISLRKFLCALIFAGGMLGVPLTAPVQTAICTIGLGSICMTIGGPTSVQTVPVPMLILYDASPNDQYTNLGKAYATTLYDPLAYFNATIMLLPVQSYTAGMTGQYIVTFYMGSYYNNPIPVAFLSDVTTTQKTVVWFKYDLWGLAWNTAYPFTTRYGTTLSNLTGMNVAPPASVPNPGFFGTITYKNQTMMKHHVFNITTGAISVGPDIGLTAVVDVTKTTSLVTITNSVTKMTAPYVIWSGGFWYFADMPFSYIGLHDRYLVVCDILHDILGTNAPTLHRTLMRLEDVNTTTTVSLMQTLTDYMCGQKTPFSTATIPVCTDPNGVYNGDVAQTIHMVSTTGLKQALNYTRARGGHALIHGYTHQYSNVLNVINTVNANDYEFWLAIQNRPVNEDSTQWAVGRLSAGLLELQFNGYFPFVRETPYYQSSLSATKTVPMYFKNTYQCVVYYTSDNLQTLAATTPGHDFSVGQFFPYTTQKDYYGRRVTSENLGNVEYNICSIDPSSCLTYNITDILTSASHVLVVRDGFAPFFFHPFWLEPGLVATGFPDFQQIITGITALDYTWADASTTQQPCNGCAGCRRQPYW